MIILIVAICIPQGCSDQQGSVSTESNSTKEYLNFSNRDDQFTGGIKMIPISTPKGDFKVWTKRVGNNPRIKVLLLHGGPGGTHESFECFDGYLPYEGIEYIYYDQLGSYYSDQPSDTSLWTAERFVEEVEQVRVALNLDKDNFFLLGQSWGGILAMEYALKYQGNIKGKTFALWGLAFKPKTDDMREAPSRVILEALIAAGANVQAFWSWILATNSF